MSREVFADWCERMADVHDTRAEYAVRQLFGDAVVDGARVAFQAGYRHGLADGVRLAQGLTPATHADVERWYASGALHRAVFGESEADIRTEIGTEHEES